MASVGKLKLPAYYFSPEEIVGLFKNNFTLLEIKPIGIVIPPSYLEPFFKNKKDYCNFCIGLKQIWGFLFLPIMQIIFLSVSKGNKISWLKLVLRTSKKLK